MKNMYEQYPECPEEYTSNESKKMVKHYVDINIPVDVIPKANVGRIEAECCGEPVVVCADGGKPDTCHLILIQKVCISIPVKYSFESKSGKGMVECCKGKE